MSSLGIKLRMRRDYFFGCITEHPLRAAIPGGIVPSSVLLRMASLEEAMIAAKALRPDMRARSRDIVIALRRFRLMAAASCLVCFVIQYLRPMLAYQQSTFSAIRPA